MTGTKPDIRPLLSEIFNTSVFLTDYLGFKNLHYNADQAETDKYFSLSFIHRIDDMAQEEASKQMALLTELQEALGVACHE